MARSVHFKHGLAHVFVMHSYLIIPVTTISFPCHMQS
jgi:hypothetical protein